MKLRLLRLSALCALFALALGSSQAHAASQPPIPVFAPAGEASPPSGAIIDSREPTTPCSDWYVQSAYGNTWATAGGWWEYKCPGPGGITEDDDPYWIDFYYWDGSRSVFYGQMYWYYDWLTGWLNGYCAYWWDETTRQWYDPWGCSEPPTASFSYSCSGLSCDFDGSASSDTDGTIVAYEWEFGDGTTATGSTAQHAYAFPGTYSVWLTVTDDLGWVGLAGSTIRASAPNQAPTARSTFSCAGLSCVFDGSRSSDSDGSVVDYDWDFGDGATRTGISVQHTYAQPGTYTVTLTVTDDDGATDTTSRSVVVTANASPTASFSSVCTGLVCSYDGAPSSDSDGTIVSYVWSLGDGTTGNGASTQHTYAQPGTYTVTLTVTDDDGAVASASMTISPITLTAAGYKVKGLQTADLAWTGTSATGFDVYRDGARIATVQAATYTDDLNRKGRGSYVYKVCAVGTSICSNEATVIF